MAASWRRTPPCEENVCRMARPRSTGSWVLRRKKPTVFIGNYATNSSLNWSSILGCTEGIPILQREYIRPCCCRASRPITAMPRRRWPMHLAMDGRRAKVGTRHGPTSSDEPPRWITGVRHRRQSTGETCGPRQDAVVVVGDCRAVFGNLTFAAAIEDRSTNNVRR